MVEREFQGVVWTAITPSQYHLKGYEGIVAYYDGEDWHFKGLDDCGLPSMEQMTKAVIKAVEIYNGAVSG
jgi:hypothetical protein